MGLIAAWLRKGVSMHMGLIALLALASGEPPAKVDEAVAAATTAVANQHVAISVLSAMYYCENQSWPESIDTVHAFHKTLEFKLPVEPDWSMLSAEGLSYSIDDQNTLTVVTTANAIAKAHKITSTNRPPGCADHNLDVNAGMHIGE